MLGTGGWKESRANVSLFVWKFNCNSLLTMIVSLVNITLLIIPILGQECKHLLSPWDTCVSVLESPPKPHFGVTVNMSLNRRHNYNFSFAFSPWSQWPSPMWSLSLSPPPLSLSLVPFGIESWPVSVHSFISLLFLRTFLLLQPIIHCLLSLSPTLAFRRMSYQ